MNWIGTNLRKSTNLSVMVLCVALVAGGQRMQGQVRDLFNNFNTGGVANQPVRPTVFSVPRGAIISELVTYHWNGGRGSRPGAIGLMSATGQFFGPFAARGYSGSYGAPNVNWVASLRVTLPPGTYTVMDSDRATWSQNPQSYSEGFAIVRGFALTQGSTPPPPPRPAPLPVSGGGGSGTPGFHPCFVNSGSVASAGPCVLAPGSALMVHMSRTLPNPPAMLSFQAVITSGVPAAVSSPLTGGGAAYTTIVPTQVCATGSGSKWDIYLYDTTGKRWGDIGQLMVDCRAFGR